MYKDTHTEKITTIHDITQRKESGNVLGNAYDPISRSTISKTHFSITTTILHFKKKKKRYKVPFGCTSKWLVEKKTSQKHYL